MNIALFGYGKMGKMIAKLAEGRGHDIVAKIDAGIAPIDYGAMDMAIDFSTPDTALGNIGGCLRHGVPVISGTTGWLQDYDKAVALCERHQGGFIYASNFSLGVNLFFELNEKLAQMMAKFKAYKPALEEIHHTQKLDAPSGTAITLAEGIITHTDYQKWLLDQTADDAITITAKRIGTIPGTHTLTYNNPTDAISIQHTAHNREGFALGAIIAAEWLLNRKGVYTMRDVLNLG